MNHCIARARDVVPLEVAAHVLHHYSPTQGYPAGSFVTALLNAFDCADPSNTHRLGLGFPAYKLAVHLARDHHDGLDTLRSIITSGA